MTSQPIRDRSAFPSAVPPIVFALALCVATWIIFASFGATNHEARGDGRFYLHYMETVHERGLAVFPALFRDWNADQQSWIFPPPSRAGFIVISALWAGIFGASIVALQYLSIAAHLLSCVVNYVFARRHFGEPRALFIGLLWMFSPLLLGISRQALTDSVIALCMATTAWLFLELVENPSSWHRRVAFMAMFGLTVLVKELSLLVLVPFTACLLVERFVRREPVNLGFFALMFALPGLVVGPIFVAAAGGLSTLLETTRIVLSSPATNPYAVNLGSGPWFRYLLDFVLLSPWTTLLALGYAGVLALRLRRGEYERVLVYMALIVVCLVFVYSFFTKNARYAVLFELPLRIMAVCMLGELFKSASARRTELLCAAAVVVLCWLDWRSFDLYWVKYPGYDPVTTVLAGLREMVPPKSH
jgi:4-amino-4-deoxy-L-arabinose transferase-like glycosyltransferase